jgi:hypothetical protein
MSRLAAAIVVIAPLHANVLLELRKLLLQLTMLPLVDTVAAGAVELTVDPVRFAAERIGFARREVPRRAARSIRFSISLRRIWMSRPLLKFWL